MQDNQENSGGKSLISIRSMDILVACFFIVFGAIVMWDSHRIGSGWAEDGPESGSFPFYVALIIVLSSIVTIINAVKDKEAAEETFVEGGQLMLVMQILIPSLLFVIATVYIGIYVSSVIFIFCFMLLLGKFSVVKSLMVAIPVPVFFFFMFEVWFKVPLPKGPLEAMIGY